MSICRNSKRGLFHLRNVPRFSFLILLLISVSNSQNDSGYVYYFSGGSEYFDLFRQHTENSRTTVFSKSSFASFSAVSATDTFSTSFRTMDYYAAMNQRATKFSSSFNNSRRNLTMLYSSSLSFVNYKLSIGTELNTPSLQLNYMLSVTMNPFDQMLSGGISFERSTIHYNTSVLFQDFLVPFREYPSATNVSYIIQSKPFDDFSTTIEYFGTDGMNDKRADGYEINSSYRTIGRNLILRYTMDQTTIFSTDIGTGELRSELLFTKNDLSFGDVLKGYGKYSHYSLDITSKKFGLPFSVKYSFSQLSLSGIGHFESWPFTTIAKSIIANRLNYQISGFIKHHFVETSAHFEFKSTSLSTICSYHRILPDAVLEHWEPEFLVFGEKNFTRNPFSVSDIHLIGIGLQYEIRFNDITFTAFAKQYIPLSITYRPRMSTSSPTPSEPTAPSTAPITDGGRTAGLFFTIAL